MFSCLVGFSSDESWALNENLDKWAYYSDFLKNDEFGLGRGQALRLQQQIVHVAIAAAEPKQSFDVTVDGFYHSHRYLRPGSSSGCPRDDRVTCGLISPSVSPAASATGQSSVVSPKRLELFFPPFS
jgi:hypothetical protein